MPSKDDIPDIGLDDDTKRLLNGLGDDAKDLLDDPKGFIIASIAGWLVGGLVDFATMLIRAVQLIYEPLLPAIDYLGQAILVPIELVNQTLLDLWNLIETSAFEVVSEAGFASPILATAITVVVMAALLWLAYRTVFTIARSTPGVRSALIYLGAD